MRRIRVHSSLRIALFAWLAPALTCALGAAPAELFDRSVADVNGELIFLSELNEAMGDAGLDELPTRLRRLERRDLLERMVDAALLRQEGERLGLEPPDEVIAEAVDERVEEIMASWPDRWTFEDVLETQGKTLASLRQELRESESDAWMRRSVVMTRVGSPPADLDLPRQMELAQIVRACPPGTAEPIAMQTYQECLALRARLLAGEVAFDEAADRWSDDGVSGPRGGSLGIMDLTRLDPGIAEALEDLDEGDVSLPVRTAQSWHLFHVRRVISPRQLWMIQAFEESRDGLVEDLRRRGHVRVFLDL